ncbi:hypothetical protein EKH55_5203 [Sinorhizobium alkalisoli]|nr:hypothetical protein EKH55_5203 [Sinorhizobium alkalisoli]
MFVNGSNSPNSIYLALTLGRKRFLKRVYILPVEATAL